MSGSSRAVRSVQFPAYAVLPLFTSAVFLSALLMFLVEPMIAKIVLPKLGGSPAVWSTCLLFFQAVLLLGYAYADLLTRWLDRRGQVFVHILVVLPLAALSLPLSLSAAIPQSVTHPVLWLLADLALSVGPAVFAISATAPLLQSWYGKTDHHLAHNPYFLYAGSNAGSLLALLAYPLLVEPVWPLDTQRSVWSWAFGLLVLFIAGTALAVISRPRIQVKSSAATRSQGSLREYATWILLAFVPSSLLLGATTHISSDIASAPLLWVVPLALYLITFILVFAQRPPIPHGIICRVLPFILIPVVLTAAPGLQVPLPVLLVLHLGCLFAAAMMCHGELARLRPEASRLTVFYFFMSVGGVLGGVFNALIAPAIFPGIWEYPIALFAVCLVRPASARDAKPAWLKDILLPLGLVAVIVAARSLFGAGAEGQRLPLATAILGFLVPAPALLQFSERRWRFAIGVAGCLLVAEATGYANTLLSARSFFGVYRIQTIQQDGARYLVMMHGTAMHGVKSLTPGEEAMPMGYYSQQGPFGIFLASTTPGTVHNVGVVGLGSGELACYAKPGERWTFFEIDPLVEKIARDPNLFGFLDRCGNHPHVVLGDARLTLGETPDHSLDILILDAFSSDSIPMHLITREALALYLTKLAPGGRLLFHISSRNLNLRPTLGALAADAGLKAELLDYNTPPAESFWRHTSAVVVAMARTADDLKTLKSSDGWLPLPDGNTSALWTDQRSDLLTAIRFGNR